MMVCKVISVWGFTPALHSIKTNIDSVFEDGVFKIGEGDMEVCTNLIAAGVGSRNFLKQITVWVDIKAPIYWWNEFKTYDEGSIANLCSVIDRINEKPFIFSDFSNDGLSKFFMESDQKNHVTFVDNREFLKKIIIFLNNCRGEYLRTNEKTYLDQIMKLLPMSYNQKGTVILTYDTILRIVKSKEDQNLKEWDEFIETLKELPYVTQWVQNYQL